MNEDLARELAAIEDELAKLKPAVEQIESASKMVVEAESALATYKENIEKLFNTAESAFKEQMEAQSVAAKGMLRDTKKTLADYTDEFERNVRKQADLGKELLKNVDEVIEEAKDVNDQTGILVLKIQSMSIPSKLNIIIALGAAILLFLILKS